MPVDGTEGCLRAFTQLKRQYPQMKVILSVGGGGKGSENFARVARSPPAVEKFASSARALVDQFDLDGIDGMSFIIQPLIDSTLTTSQWTGSTPQPPSKVSTISTYWPN
jgi:hypothetical protein